MGIFSSLLANAGQGLAAYDEGQDEGRMLKAKRADADRIRKVQEAQVAVAQAQADAAQRRSFADLLKAGEGPRSAPPSVRSSDQGIVRIGASGPAEPVLGPDGKPVMPYHSPRAPRATAGPSPAAQRRESAAKMDEEAQRIALSAINYHKSATTALKKFDERATAGQPATPLTLKVREFLARQARAEGAQSGGALGNIELAPKQ